MKMRWKVLPLALVAVLAFSAVSVASASAAPKFTASAAGKKLTGAATSNQVFKTNGGTTTCTKAATTGETKALETTEQEVTVTYTGCTAFGFINVEITPATYRFTANGEVHILNTITIKPIGAGCTVTVGPQTVKSVSYDNVVKEGFTGIEETSAVGSIVYTSTGGICGSSGANGTYTGNSFLHTVEAGQTIKWDKE